MQGTPEVSLRGGRGRVRHRPKPVGSRPYSPLHALDRHLRTPGKTLASQQTIQNWAAEMRAEINASRLMVLHAAHKIDREGSYAARDEISLIKFYVANVLQQVLDRAIQAYGAMGMTDELPLAWWYRHERAARIYDGPDEVHKRSVARRIFKRYA